VEYIIYCDESIRNGKYFSDFSGGALVRSTDYLEVLKELKDKKESLNLHQEIKWTKATANYLKKYKEMMTCFF
jgi:chaperonin cofactor prefoldin